MCGLLGGIGPGIDRLDEAACRAALACIRHRGPDAEGLWRAPGVMLGHRRLSIIDLDPRSHQPMHRSPMAIVFNGEVYNYRELKRELEADGHGFSTTSDTEVLLAGLSARGPAFLERVEGMFAFAAWNARDRTLLLARDRYGEKPLFLLRQRDSLAFASELASLEALAEQPLQEDEVATGLYFRFSYVPAPFAPLQGTSQLEPGTFVRIGSDLAAKPQRYYSIPAASTAPAPRYEDAVEELRGRLTQCVSARLTAADVPVATLLSGGLDSSIVTVLAARTYGRRVRAYSLGFPDDPAFDESPYARAVAARIGSIEHRVVNARVDDLLAFTERVFDKLSEPLADASLIPTAYLLSQVEEKVVLGGDGADEVFAGYGVYPAMRLSASLPSPLKALLRAIPAHGNPASLRQPQLRAAALFHANLGDSPGAEYLRWRTYASGPDLEQLGLDLSGEALVAEHLAVTGSGRLRDIQEADITFNLPNDMLRKVDIAAMMFGIEGRLPYLDSGLVAFALSLPESFLIKGGVRKRILRDAFAADLPPEILTRRKMGFLMPIRAWFRAGPLRDHLEARVAAQGRFEPATVRRLVAEHASGQTDHSVLLWSLLVFLSWRDKRAALTARAA